MITVNTERLYMSERDIQSQAFINQLTLHNAANYVGEE